MHEFMPIFPITVLLLLTFMVGRRMNSFLRQPFPAFAGDPQVKPARYSLHNQPVIAVISKCGLTNFTADLHVQGCFPRPVPGEAGICDFHKSIKARYDRKGIDIPFACRMVANIKSARDMEEIHGF